MTDGVPLLWFVSIQVHFYCIASVFGVTDMLKSKAAENLERISFVLCSFFHQFEQNLQTTGCRSAPNHKEASAVFVRWL